MGQAKRRKEAGEYPVVDGAKVPHERQHPRARPSCGLCHGTGYLGWTRENEDRALVRAECTCTSRAMRPKPTVRDQAKHVATSMHAAPRRCRG